MDSFPIDAFRDLLLMVSIELELQRIWYGARSRWDVLALEEELSALREKWNVGPLLPQFVINEGDMPQEAVERARGLHNAFQRQLIGTHRQALSVTESLLEEVFEVIVTRPHGDIRELRACDIIKDLAVTQRVKVVR